MAMPRFGAFIGKSVAGKIKRLFVVLPYWAVLRSIRDLEKSTRGTTARANRNRDVILLFVRPATMNDALDTHSSPLCCRNVTSYREECRVIGRQSLCVCCFHTFSDTPQKSSFSPA